MAEGKYREIGIVVAKQCTKKRDEGTKMREKNLRARKQTEQQVAVAKYFNVRCGPLGMI
jgi:hypothetical protein